MRSLLESVQDVFHNIPEHIRQSIISSCVAVGEMFVVQTEKVENRGVKVRHGDFIVLNVIAKFVSLAKSHATFHTAAGQPDTEGVRVMIATVGALSGRRATKLRAKDDQRVFKQATLF